MKPKKIKLKKNKDNRGFFLKLFCKESLSRRFNNLDIKIFKDLTTIIIKDGTTKITRQE